MSEQLDPNKLDLIGVLSGRDYPEVEVPVYFNEKLGFEIYQIKKRISEAEARGDSDLLDKLDSKRAELVEKSEGEKYIVTLQGVPEKVYRAIVDEVNEEFPNETDFLGKTKPNPQGDGLFTRKLWQAYLRTVTGPDGSKNHVGKEEIEALIDKAPESSQIAITQGISELRSGPRAGFEYAAKEVDFLSHASPEG